jgi:hypothetical protein
VDTEGHPGRRIFGDESRNVRSFEQAVRRQRDRGKFAAQQPCGGGAPGTLMYRELQRGRLSYRMYSFIKD